ncbi:MAG: nicotinate (nicotinamide) nucleotide adenylyltransferase [Clostridiaceae bacterium]|nr:nicotinate (nicotinamide) nucleotide adenylyltransferase [Clostridiaceae bacterium]
MANKIKIAIYGGSFDPFHNGHKKVLEGLLKLNKFDQIIVMPLGLAPHKDKYMTPSGYRYEMTRLGIKDLPGLTLSDYEINRPGQYSYTVDTIDFYKQKIYNDYINEELKKLSKQRVPRGEKTKYKTDATSLKNLQNVKVKISLVYGSDALDTIENWYEPEQIMRKAKLLICRRGSDNFKHMNERAEYLRSKYQANIEFFQIEETDISSTQLRKKLKKDKKQNNKLPPAVCRYIKNNKIYVFHDEMAQLNREQLIQLAVYEKEVRKNVSRSRLNHSLNVMQYSVHLATRHNYDLMKAAVTGILHDIAKSMKIEKQYRFAKKTGKLSPLNKNIAHGPAGAWYIHRYLGVTDREILDALIFHTTSRRNMTKLDQIIYLADKLEYGRPFANLEDIREVAETDLTSAMKLCLKEVRLALRRQSKKGHPATKAATKYLDSN